jgi:hypothetical protein
MAEAIMEPDLQQAIIAFRYALHLLVDGEHQGDGTLQDLWKTDQVPG